MVSNWLLADRKNVLACAESSIGVMHKYDVSRVEGRGFSLCSISLSGIVTSAARSLNIAAAMSMLDTCT